MKNPKGIKKTITGGKIKEAFVIERVLDKKTGELVKQGVVVRKSEEEDN